MTEQALTLPANSAPFVDSAGRLTQAGRGSLNEMIRRLQAQITDLQSVVNAIVELQTGQADITDVLALKADKAQVVVGSGSLKGGGTLENPVILTLENDQESPGPNVVYGTDSDGDKGWMGLGLVSVGNAETLDGEGPSFYLDRTHHTGEQAISTVTGLQDALDAKQDEDATLTALAGANWALNALPIGAGVDTVSQVTFAANTFPARASTGNLVAKAISDDALAFLAAANDGAMRSELGGTTVGQALFTAANPSAIRFIRVNADNSITMRSAADFRSDIGAGTGSGTVTSVAVANATGITWAGSPITGSGTFTPTLSTNLQSWSGISPADLGPGGYLSAVSDLDSLMGNGGSRIFRTDGTSSTNTPGTAGYVGLSLGYNSSANAQIVARISGTFNELWWRNANGGAYTAWSQAVDTTRALTAGDGLTGGGTLAADRTFTLGTPGTLTGSTTNDVTATSHTHALTANLQTWAGTTPAAFVGATGNQTGLSGDKTWTGAHTFTGSVKADFSVTVLTTDHVLVIADAGAQLRTTFADTGSTDIDVTFNTGIFAGGDAILIFNSRNAGVINLVPGGGFSLHTAGMGSSSSTKTIAPRGWAVVLFQTGTAASAAGPGMSG